MGEASNFVFNAIAMRHPVSGEPITEKEYFKGGFPIHLVGVFGGLVWGLGNGINLVAAGKSVAEPDHLRRYAATTKKYAKLVRHMNSNDAPDANEVYRRILAAQPDKSVVICSVGFLTNLRRLIETKPDDISPLDGRALAESGANEWAPDAENGPHLRVTERMPKAEVGRVIDELMMRRPHKSLSECCN